MQLSAMTWWDAEMWCLRHCNLDQRTVRNVRDGIPALRSRGMFDPAEIDAAVAQFEARVASADQAVLKAGM